MESAAAELMKWFCCIYCMQDATVVVVVVNGIVITIAMIMIIIAIITF